MNFYSIKNIPARPGEEKVFKTWPLPKMLVFAIFSTVSGLLIYLGYRGGYHANGVRLPAEICYWTGGVLALFAWMSFYFARNAFVQANWLLKVSPEYLRVKYRSYHNHRFPQDDPVVVEIPTGSIEWIREVHEKLTIPQMNDGGSITHTFTYLDLKLSPKIDFLQIKQALHTERQRKVSRKGIVSGRVLHYPVQYVEPGILRLDWQGIRPGIKKAIGMLKMQFTLKTAENFQAKEWDQLEGREIEDGILDLARRGRTIDAAHLAALKLNLGTTKAVQFVRELTGKAPR